MTRRGPSWHPILQGPTAAAAWTSVRAIADDLASVSASAGEARAGDMLLFWAYVAGALDDEASNHAYEAAMARFMTLIEGEPFAATGLYGWLWNPWVLMHVSDASDHAVYFAAIDATLAELLAPPRWEGPYELLYGLAGYGVYQLDRLAQLNALAAAGTTDTSSARALVRRNLAAIVSHLERLARHEADGLTWFTSPTHLPAHHRDFAPGGYFNLGLAHGVPGVVGMLGRLAGTEAASPAATTLLKESVRWVRSQRRGRGEKSLFPSQVVPGQPMVGKRTAWCYGDPGVIATLWLAAKHLGEPDDEIEALALICAERAPLACGVHDAGLCHGSMGLAHIYNRFYQASGNERLRDAARRWFEHGLAEQHAHAAEAATPAVGGYLQWMDVGGGVEGWGGAASLLTGSGGIALALLAGLGHEEPLWDRMLLVDIPVK